VTAVQGSPTSGGRISPRTAVRLAWALWVVAILVTALAMVLVVLTRSLARPAYNEWKTTLCGCWRTCRFRPSA
jgi:uncharacterized integral membrane protein